MTQTNGSHALEQVSALVDGQLQGQDFAGAVEAVGMREDLRENWQIYHIVGEVLRSGVHAPCTDSQRFMIRLRQELATLPGGASAPVVSIGSRGATPVRNRPEAANEPVFRWKMMAGVATVAAAAVIGWTWIGQVPASDPVAGSQVAQQQAQPAAPVAVAAEAPSVLAAAASAGAPASAGSRTRVMVGNGAPQLMLRDARLDALLEAHQQASGASQMPAGFLRNATFEAPSR